MRLAYIISTYLLGLLYKNALTCKIPVKFMFLKNVHTLLYRIDVQYEIKVQEGKFLKKD